MPASLSPVVSFVIIVFAVAAYGGVHSLLAALGVKQATFRLGTWAARGYRLAYNLFAGITLLPVLALPALLPDQPVYTIAFPWLLLTLLVQLGAGLALLYGVLQTGVWSFLGLSQLASPVPDGPPQLVTNGLYRWVRHPLYTAGMVFIWLTPVMSTNILALDLALTVYLIVGAMLEERKLLKEFGPVYAAYRRRTPMFLPGLKRSN